MPESNNADATPTTGGPPTAEQVETRLRTHIRRLLDQVAVEKRPCKACLRDLWFVINRRGNRMPYTDEATCHFADCPAASKFRRTKAPACDATGQDR